jgi:hypothetical protein
MEILIKSINFKTDPVACFSLFGFYTFGFAPIWAPNVLSGGLPVYAMECSSAFLASWWCCLQGVWMTDKPMQPL